MPYASRRANYISLRNLIAEHNKVEEQSQFKFLIHSFLFFFQNVSDCANDCSFWSRARMFENVTHALTRNTDSDKSESKINRVFRLFLNFFFDFFFKLKKLFFQFCVSVCFKFFTFTWVRLHNTDQLKRKKNNNN